MNCLDSSNDFQTETGGNSLELDPYEIQIWHYQAGKKLKRQVFDLKKKYKQMSSFVKESPLNYFSRNLVFWESSAKNLGNILEEYLDSNEYKIVIDNEEQDDAIT